MEEKNSNSQFNLSYRSQKLLSRKYVGWLYELLNEGKLYDLPFVKRCKDFPKKGSEKYFYYGHDYSQDEVNVSKIVDENIPEGAPVKYFERIYNCGSHMSGYYNPVRKKYIVTDGNFCENRLCPICAVKRSRRDYAKISFQMEHFQEEYEYYFLTLTLPDNPDGFGEELTLYNQVLPELLRFFGFRTDDDSLPCKGAYGSYEIKIGKNSGAWHPHLHLILAYPKDRIINYESVEYFDGIRNRVNVNDFAVQWSHKKIKHFSTDSIRERFIQIVQRITDKYDQRFAEKRFLNVGFEKCYNIEQGRNELCKYLIDFEDLRNKEDLLVYLRDSFGRRQRVRRGIFIWTDDWDDAFNLWKAQKKDEELNELVENGIFILYNTVCPCEFVWTGVTYCCTYWYESTVPIPYTNRTKRVMKTEMVFLE